MMRKFVVYGFGLMICLAAGCKKDHQNSKVYLLRQQITDDREDGAPIDTTNYTYDGQNRLTLVTDGTGSNKRTFTVAYDSQNRVSTARKLDGSGNLVVQYDFIYKGDTVGYHFFGPPSESDTSYFTFNSKHQVTQLTSNHSGYETYEYDNKGNVALTESYGSDGSNGLADAGAYQYDNMKNPFSGTSPNNFFLMYIVLVDNPSTLINNATDKNGFPTTYTYNQDGFPISGITNTYYTQIYFYYNYTVK